ncbi:MAG: PadR family transcriptional regulator [Anaerolineales bacterium]|nr:PadR family transcriptional regulator [Chloroflexota bacterium]MBL6980104.1 PadR family transcriptional regulator [Anaerolineales bacterium]
MDKILFLLGLIRNADMYGYQINELLDSHFDIIVSITRPTAYRLLNKMTADGWISFREEQIGNRPPRKVFSITPKGEDAFQKILRQSLVNYSPSQQSSAVSLAFLRTLPADELLPLLTERRRLVQELLRKLGEGEQHQGDFHLLFEHQRQHFETELTWTEDMIARVQAESLG